MATNPHIYVSNQHGTNSGASDTSKSSQQTGNITSMAAGDVYEDLGAAIAGCTPGDGDTIYVCDNHNASYDNGTNPIFNNNGDDEKIGLKIISVDNTAIDEYKPGASDSITDGSDDFRFANNGFSAGVNYESADNIQIDTGGHWIFQDCTLKRTGANDQALLLGFGSHVELFNVDIDCNNVNGLPMNLNGSMAKLFWYGGSVLNASNFTLMSGGRASVEIYGVDFTSCTYQRIIDWSDVYNYRGYMKLVNCRLNSACTQVISQYGKHPGAFFSMFHTDTTTNDDYHRFIYGDAQGEAVNNDSVYVTNTEAWNGESDKSSIAVTTEAQVDRSLPFSFELLAQFVDLSAGASDKISIEIVTAETLNKGDIAAFLVYRDGTNVKGNLVSSGPVASGYKAPDPLTTAALASSSLDADDWTGEPGSPNFYALELDTSGDAGEACVIAVRIEVYKPSISTNPIYIHPIMTLS